MKITGYSDTLAGACGISCIGGFEESDGDRNDWYGPQDDDFITYRGHLGGADWTSAGFIDNDECKAAYAILKKQYKIVLQSPVRINRNSGNSFFFAVYDGKPKVARRSNNLKYKWPFKNGEG